MGVWDRHDVHNRPDSQVHLVGGVERNNRLLFTWPESRSAASGTEDFLNLSQMVPVVAGFESDETSTCFGSPFIVGSRIVEKRCCNPTEHSQVAHPHRSEQFGGGVRIA